MGDRILDGRIANFLMREAQKKGFKVHTRFVGEIELYPHFQIYQLVGGVYGVWASCSPPPVPEGVKPVEDDWFPVCWGKDITPCSRVSAHVYNYKGTGNLNLSSIPELKGRLLLFGAILVSRYEEFESYLHEVYPPLKGSARVGKRSRKVQIVG